MFHVEHIKKVSVALICAFILVGCISQRHTIEINDYILVENGKEILGREKGLTAFIFENNPKKIPFAQFVADKYNVGSYNDVAYWVTVDGHRLKIFVYENAELEKYFNLSDFMVTKAEAEANVLGSTAKFLGLSVINNYNEDCLDDASLFKNIAVQYLKNLKDEYNNL